MPTTPNPATTEWVPLWDLNGTTPGGGGTGGPHHATHEVGGTDLIQNNAWTNQPNIFTQNQSISSVTPVLKLTYTGSTAPARLIQPIAASRVDVSSNLVYNGANWVGDDSSQAGAIYVQQDGQHTFFTSPPGTNPRILSQQMNINAQGVTNIPGGLGTTPLNASQITSGTIPDARLSTNVALKNAANVFTTAQTINCASAELRLIDSSQPIDTRVFRIFNQSQNLYFQSTDDAISISQGLMYLNRASVLNVPGGLGATPLNATQLTSGSIPDARLSTNVAFKNIYNYFTAEQWFQARTGLSGPNSWFFLNDTSGPVDNRYWRIVQYGDGNFQLEAFNDAISICTGRVTVTRTGEINATGLSSTPLNASNLTSGTVPLARLPGVVDQVSGNWTPILGGTGGETGQVYNYQQGVYIRIGKMVTLWCYTQFKGPADGGAPGAKGVISGNVCMRNFPFPIGNSLPFTPFIAGSVAYYSNLFTPQDITGLSCYGPSTHPYALIMKLRSGTQNPIPMTGGDLNDSSQMILTISYIID